MGIGQSTGGVCTIPADYTLSSDQRKELTASEIQRYVSSIRQSVSDRLESFEARYERYMSSFEPDVEVLKRCAAEIMNELQLGLELHRDFGEVDPTRCSVKMLDAYVPHPPTGRESGVYYALDFGGSNFRVLRCNMDNGKIEVRAKRASLLECKCDYPKGLMDPKATASEMFDFFAMKCKEFMLENGDMKSNSDTNQRPFNVGFTFSYPCSLRGIDSGELIVWTKGFETGRDTMDPVEGNDVCILMNEAFRRHAVPLKINCVANDTVGTLLSCAYTLADDNQPNCYIGVILGTGMNAAYVDPKASAQFGYVGNIINIESGNYNLSLPRTNIDYEIDFSDVAGRGLQQLEKMCSGAYLGEMVRRACVKIFQYHATSAMYQQNSFTSQDASVCLSDASPTLIACQKKALEQWNVQLTPQQAQWLKNISAVVFRRSAALGAALIAGIAMKTGRLQPALGGITVGIDGSLWKCNPQYRADLKHYLKEILGEKTAALIHCVNSDDGSGLGAAILSAVAASAT